VLHDLCDEAVAAKLFYIYYEVVEAGFKYNMTDMQAALGLVQLKKVEWMWEKRLHENIQKLLHL
jgi:dTDP-4-amino-4,6-dideoxygalactose transaminase